MDERHIGLSIGSGGQVLGQRQTREPTPTPTSTPPFRDVELRKWALERALANADLVTPDLVVKRAQAYLDFVEGKNQTICETARFVNPITNESDPPA